jgi:hypothetical protein
MHKFPCAAQTSAFTNLILLIESSGVKFAGPSHWPKVVGWAGIPSRPLLTLDLGQLSLQEAKMKPNDAALEFYQKSTTGGGISC